jgi:hypothetical protein
MSQTRNATTYTKLSAVVYHVKTASSLSRSYAARNFVASATSAPPKLSR